jgi:hypothetical protein
MKNFSDTTGNRARDLLTCSAVPQPTALLRAPTVYKVAIDIKVKHKYCSTIVRYSLAPQTPVYYFSCIVKNLTDEETPLPAN